MIKVRAIVNKKENKVTFKITKGSQKTYYCTDFSEDYIDMLEDMFLNDYVGNYLELATTFKYVR